MHDTQSNIKLRKYIPQPEALQLIPEAMARKYTVIPLEVNGNVLRVAMADATNIFTSEALENHTHHIEAVYNFIDIKYLEVSSNINWKFFKLNQFYHKNVTYMH